MAGELGRVRANARTAQKASAERGPLIRAARDAGEKIADIAEAAGLSPMHVHRILREYPPAGGNTTEVSGE